MAFILPPSMSAAARFERRREAWQAREWVAAIASDFRVNDDHKSHWTVWQGKQRIDWYPGSARWECNGQKTTGDLEDFLAFLAALPPSVPSPDFQVIED